MAVEQSRKSLLFYPCSDEKQLYSIEPSQAVCSYVGTELPKPLILVNFGASLNFLSATCNKFAALPPAKTGNFIGLLIYPSVRDRMKPVRTVELPQTIAPRAIE